MPTNSNEPDESENEGAEESAESEEPTGNDEPLSEVVDLPSNVNAQHVEGGVYIPEEELEGAGDDPSSRGATIQAKKTSLHVGPLPPPDQLRQYDEILSGGADELLEMAKGELEHQRSRNKQYDDHRQRLENQDQENDRSLTQTGMVFGFLIAAGALTVIGMMVVWGYSTSAVIALSVALLILSVVFVTGRRYRSKDIASSYLKQIGRAAQAAQKNQNSDGAEQGADSGNQDRSG